VQALQPQIPGYPDHAHGRRWKADGVPQAARKEMDILASLPDPFSELQLQISKSYPRI
jgi:hypothetical protein